MWRQVVAIILVILSTAASAQHVPVDWVDVAEESGYSLLPATRLTGNGDGTYSGGGLTLSTSGNVDYTLGYSGGVASIAGRDDYWTGELITYSGQRYWHITGWADPPEEPEEPVDPSVPRQWVQVHVHDVTQNTAAELGPGVFTMVYNPEGSNQYRYGGVGDEEWISQMAITWRASHGYMSGNFTHNRGATVTAEPERLITEPWGTGLWCDDDYYKVDIVAVGPPISEPASTVPPSNPGGTPDPDPDPGGGSEDPPDSPDPPDPPEEEEDPEDPEDPPTTPSEPSGFDCIDDWLEETQDEGFGAFIADFAGVSSRPYSYTISIPFPFGPDITATITSDPSQMAYASSPLDTLRKWIRLVLTCIVVWKFGSAILTTVKQY